MVSPQYHMLNVLAMLHQLCREKYRRHATMHALLPYVLRAFSPKQPTTKRDVVTNVLAVQSDPRLIGY